MKKNLVNLIALIILTFILTIVSPAQFGDLINKAKDAAMKKDKGKKDEKNSEDLRRSENQQREIHFSNQPFPDGGSVAGAKVDFNSNEYIYGRLFLKNGTIRDVLKPIAPNNELGFYNVEFRIYVLTKGYSPGLSSLGGFYKALLNEADLDKNYWDFDILPPSSSAKSLFYHGGNYNGGFTYANALYYFMAANNTEEGKHEIYVEIKSNGVDFRGNPLPENQRKVVKEGFYFSFRGSDYAAAKANHDYLEKKIASNYKKAATENQAAPPEWTAKTSPIIGGFTVASVSNLYVNSFSTGSSSLKIIKLYASAPKGQGVWLIQNNNYGIPAYRYSTQYFTAFIRDTGNGVCYFQGFGLRQNYAGAGTYGKTIIDHGKSALIKCDKLGVK